MLVTSCVLLAFASIAGGTVLVNIGGKKVTANPKYKSMIVGGWAAIVTTIVASIVGIMVYCTFNDSSLATILFTLTLPVFLLIGFIFMIGLGIANLVKGYEKNEDGTRNISKIVSGWALLILAIVLVLAVIITLTIVFNQQSNTHPSNHIGAM